MPISRRALIKAAGAAPLAGAALAHGLSWPEVPLNPPAQLPDKASFRFPGTYLNAAYTHPMSRQAAAAGEAHLELRQRDASRAWPGDNPRNAAVRAFAELIHAEPSEVAVVPSTMEGENLIGQALGLGPDAGVLTDAFHYDASLAMYGELQRLRGVPVSVVKPRANRMDLEDFAALLQPSTRLIAVSLVASMAGFAHDLKALCDLAHARNVLVYADIVQAAGAVPIDVKASGVDFCCCGTYKWLMGDFGTAFLYVRGDRLERLRRVQFGWRQFSGEQQHVYPFDAPGPVIGDWKLGNSTAAHFEVSTPDWAALAIVTASLGYIQSIGVAAIQQHRQALIDRLQQELPRRGFLPLTPQPSRGPVAAFAYRDAPARLGPRLRQAGITITMYDHMIRISPSVYNDEDDIERLLRALPAS
ncbi:MAG TPA: aminotransferase class V-fold PLP-dependent enzyme [Terriglobales bacterium]|nr:aminotransferase class V-fold PLP-dependent enzyme [Terriglobales bacterium]